MIDGVSTWTFCIKIVDTVPKQNAFNERLLIPDKIRRTLKMCKSTVILRKVVITRQHISSHYVLEVTFPNFVEASVL